MLTLVILQKILETNVEFFNSLVVDFFVSSLASKNEVVILSDWFSSFGSDFGWYDHRMEGVEGVEDAIEQKSSV